MVIHLQQHLLALEVQQTSHLHKMVLHALEWAQQGRKSNKLKGITENGNLMSYVHDEP